MLQSLLQADTSALLWTRGLVDPSYAHIIQIIGESIVLWGAFVLLFIWLTGVAKKNNQYRTWALEIFFIIILTFIVHAIINLGVPQWRMSPQEVAGGFKPLIPHPIDNSFPSGHALFTASLLVGLWNFYRKWWIIGITIAIGLLTASARVIGGVHYPGDILGGWFFGIIGGCIALYAIRTSIFQVHIFPRIIRMMKWIRL
ncbi:MAG: phosphatase PAP2 family protein [Candidatus Gracilibacteria bacterium]|nr:phosphatase PAP2 family protein [Candidatus Gracilibacteria bacterium]